MRALKKNRGQVGSGRANELQKASLLGAAEVAIIVCDVSVALVVIIQFCVVPIAIVGLAARMEIVAAGMNLFAGLNVRTTWTIHILVSAWSAIGCSRDATQITVIIDDLALTFSVVIQFCVVPIAVPGLAARFQIVSVALDVLTGLAIRNPDGPCRISALIRWRAVACPGDALQVAIIVQDVAAALVVIIELGFMPTAIASLAARMQIVAAHMDVLARLRIRSAWAVPRLISARAVAGRSATQHSVIVGDVTAAALHVWKLGVDPVAVAVLAIRGKNISIHSNVVAGLLV